MQYETEGSIPAVFKNGRVLVEVAGNTLDLMEVPSMEDMRVVLTALTVDAVTKSLTTGIQPPKTPVEQKIDQGPDLEGYADKIRQSFQEQVDKSQERLDALAGLDAATSQ